MKCIVETYRHCKSYGRKKALDGLELSIPAGKVTGLLGPNGAGKSTLLKMIAGVARPDSGDIKVLNRQPHWSLNTEIAYLPDRGRWYAFQSVQEALKHASTIFPRFDLARAQDVRSSRLRFYQPRGLSLQGIRGAPASYFMFG